MEEKFKNVLNDDEKIVAVTNATKAYATKRTVPFIVVTILSTILFGGLALGLGHQGFPWIVPVVIILFFTTLTIVLNCLFKRGQQNYYACLTNKRVIIKHGIFNNNFNYYSIENVSGNITINCMQSIFDENRDNDCAILAKIELLPVGHEQLLICTSNLANGYNFAKQLENVVKENSKSNNLKIIKE